MDRQKIDRRNRAGGRSEEDSRRSDDLSAAIQVLPQRRIDEILSRIQTRKQPST